MIAALRGILLRGAEQAQSTVSPDGPDLNNLPDFSLEAFGHSDDFAPNYYPERVNVSKKRELSRTTGLCADENINDTGAKNREFHINGYLLESEKSDFHDAIDAGKPYVLTSMPKSGRVLLESAELEGPLGIDDRYKEWVYEYTIKAVATGTDFEDNGILSEGG